MNDPTTGSELTPLDQILQIETDVIGQIAAARVSAGRSIASARTEAAQLKNQYRESGLRAGQARYRQIVQKAEEEAKAIVAEANKQAEAMHKRAQQRMEEAVQKALTLIIGLAEKGDKP